MSGGVSLPRFSITVPQRASVSVAAMGRPVVTSVTTRGQQGLSAYEVWLSAGNTGSMDDYLASLVSTVPGPPGNSGLFGTIDYTDNDACQLDANGAIIPGIGTPVDLPPGQWVRIIRNLTPSQANYNLPHGPFAGFAFWDNVNGLLRARKRGDSYLFKFTYTVIPAQKGAGVRFAVRPGDNADFDFGPKPIVLTADADQPQTGSETFSEQARPRFVDLGAYIYMMATEGATLVGFSPEVTPLDPAP